MKITITGPRSVGKSTISKIVAKKLDLKFISSDKIGEKSMKKYGGLDKAIKSGLIGKFIKNSAYGLIREVYRKDNFVFDLSGGAFASRKYNEASKKVRETAKKNSIIIGLLPSKNARESIDLLFLREGKRDHFKGMDKLELLEKVKEDFMKYPRILDRYCDFIIYTKGKSSKDVADEIVKKIKNKMTRLK